jgi:hypothetical protein
MKSFSERLEEAKRQQQQPVANTPSFQQQLFKHQGKQKALDEIERYKAEIRALEKSNWVELQHELHSNSVSTRTFVCRVEPADQYNGTDVKEGLDQRLQLAQSPEGQLATLFVFQLIELKKLFITALEEVFIGKRKYCESCSGQGNILNQVDDQEAIVICPECKGERTVEVNG